MYSLETYKNKDGIIYETSPALLERSIFLAFTTRHKGVSVAPYDTLNLAFRVADENENVIENRKIISEAFEYDANRLTTAQQAHGNNSEFINNENIGAGSLDFETAIKKTDGLVTNLPDVPLAMFFADCLPVVMVSQKDKVIAIAHAGYKGLLNGVILDTLNKISKKTSLTNLLVFLGPSIGRCCYKVEKDRMKIFKQRFPKADIHGDRIDLKEIAAIQLNKAGIKEDNIYRSSYCTCCNSDLFYSYRKNKTTGRQAAIAYIVGKREA